MKRCGVSLTCIYPETTEYSTLSCLNNVSPCTLLNPSRMHPNYANYRFAIVQAPVRYDQNIFNIFPVIRWTENDSPSDILVPVL